MTDTPEAVAEMLEELDRQSRFVVKMRTGRDPGLSFNGQAAQIIRDLAASMAGMDQMTKERFLARKIEEAQREVESWPDWLKATSQFEGSSRTDDDSYQTETHNRLTREKDDN